MSDLCVVVQMPQSTVSRHLKVLSDEGWIVRRRVATTHRYRTVLDELEPGQRGLWLLTREQTEGWATLAQDESGCGPVWRRGPKTPKPSSPARRPTGTRPGTPCTAVTSPTRRCWPSCPTPGRWRIWAAGPAAWPAR